MARLCWRVNVDRTTPNSFAIFLYEKISPGFHDSVAAIAALIGSILVEMRRVEVGVLHARVARFCDAAH